jgi:hypothetical protein
MTYNTGPWPVPLQTLCPNCKCRLVRVWDKNYTTSVYACDPCFWYLWYLGSGQEKSPASGGGAVAGGSDSPR